MRAALTFRRSDGSESNVTITADAEASVSEVAHALTQRDPRATASSSTPGQLTLAMGATGERILDPAQPLGEANFVSGEVVSVRPSPKTPQRAAAATVHILGGPDAGRRFTVPHGSTVIGRADEADLVLNDRMISKRHARLDVGATIELTDLGSANGLVVDGEVFSRLTLSPDQRVLLGDTLLRVQPLSQAESTRGTGGSLPFTRAPRLTPRFTSREFPAPQVPVVPKVEPFSWFALVAPILMAGAMFAMTRNAFSLVFVAMTPLMAVGRHYEQKSRQRRALAESIAQFEDQLGMLEADIARERPRERAIRCAEAPAASEILLSLAQPGGLTWTRRPEHPAFLSFRLGTATAPSRLRVAESSDGYLALREYAQRLAEFRERVRLIDGVPIVESATDAGGIGIAGESSAAGEILNGLIMQAAGLHAPGDLVIAAVTSPSFARELAWLSWLPHTASPSSPLGQLHLADSPATANALLARLEQLVAQRTGASPAWRTPMPSETQATATSADAARESVEQPPASAEHLPAIVLIVTDDAPIARERLLALTEIAANAGVHVLWLAPTRSRLPATCRTFAEVGTVSNLIGFVRASGQIKDVEFERVPGSIAARFARQLAPLVDDSVIHAGSSAVPNQVSLLSLIGTDLPEQPPAVVERWHETESITDHHAAAPTPKRPGTLHAAVGTAATGALLLDLRAHGPHALVGGTTGSGKSEFLQAWVLALAATYSPDRVTFLFVDYKGGSAFADCVELPHCVGLVTDLTPHLVQRALTSLRAELHRREAVLNEKKAKDLPTLEQRGDPEAPPSLVIVIDEFAALATEVPEFVDGVVDIAQRGRSLGIHLIMATQRPAGVIKDNLRANTNLRIALRMADEHDSHDVVGENDAAHFSPTTPGRGLAKFGPGRLTVFQSAYAGGRTDETTAPNIDIASLGFGAPAVWAEPERTRANTSGPTDQARLVKAIRAANTLASIPAARLPWLPELPEVLALERLEAASDGELVLGLVDEPHLQRQTVLRWQPDRDGPLAMIGTGASGKSTALRTIAAAAGRSAGWAEVQAIDFGGGALRMLEALPGVGTVIDGDDTERVTRLLSELDEELERRTALFAEAHAATLAEYRATTENDLPRVIVLLDGFAGFRDHYDAIATAPVFASFSRVLLEGRAAGLHIAFTTDRLGSIPSALQAGITRRMSFRQADDSQYSVAGVPRGMLGADSPAGRVAVDGREAQFAVVGGSASVSVQADALQHLAERLRAEGAPHAPEVRALPLVVAHDEIAPVCDGLPVLGLSGTTLAPLAFDPAGTFLITGGVQSGRSNTLAVIVRALRQAHPDAFMFYVGPPSSPIARQDWALAATSPEEALPLLSGVAERMRSAPAGVRLITIIESLGDLQSTLAESAAIDVAKTSRRTGHTVIAEGESHVLSSGWQLYTEFKVARRGIVMQPASDDGDALLRTSFPRLQRDEFPPGRGMVSLGRELHRVQVPLLASQEDPANHTK